MNNYWLTVASRDHVQVGLAGGFIQVCHGKRAPMARIKAGDEFVCYSPKTSLQNGKSCKAFTAIGKVISPSPYQVDMGNGFMPFRKDVHFFNATDVSVRDVFDQLELTQTKNWGYQLRFGLVSLSKMDFEIIKCAMLIEPITSD